MTPTSYSPQRPYRAVALALAACTGLYGIDLACLSFIPAQGLALAANIAVPFDLMICVPVAFYFLVIRRFRTSPLFVLPVIYCGAFVSSQFVQINSFCLIAILLPATAIIDVVIVVLELRRFARAFKSARTETKQPLVWFEESLLELLPSRRAAHMGALELTMWYYTLACWKKKPHIPNGSTAFPYHRESGFLTLCGVLLAIMPIEIFVVHLLIMRWSWIAALIVTTLSVYAIIWMIGSMRAVVLNPILVDDDTVTVRWGAYFSERIPLQAIRNIESTQPGIPKKECLDMGMIGSNPCWIILSEPMPMKNTFGKTRTIRAINVTPDNAADFKKAIAVGRVS